MKQKKKQILLFLTFALLMLVPAYATVTFLLTMNVGLVLQQPKVYFDYGEDSSFLNVTLGANKTTATMSIPVYPAVTSIYNDSLRIYAQGSDYYVKLRLASTPTTMEWIEFLYVNLTDPLKGTTDIQLYYDGVAGDWAIVEGENSFLLSAGNYLIISIKVKGKEGAPLGESYALTIEVVAEQVSGA